MVNIHVKVTNDGDFYCKKDPEHMKLSDEEHRPPDDRIRWHCSTHEFIIEFSYGNPFDENMELKLESDNREIIMTVKGHDDLTVYAYSVGPQELVEEQRMADPGLIIEP